MTRGCGAIAGIVGSAPNLDIRALERCTDVYFANAAVSLAQRASDKRCTWVLSDGLLYTRRQGPDIAIKQREIRGSSVHHTIVATTHKRDTVARTLDRYAISTNRLSIVTPRARSELIQAIVGPFLASASLLRGAPIRNYIEYLLDCVSSWPDDSSEPREPSHHFRPSTGVFALVCALAKFGEDGKYLITGLSLKPGRQWFDKGPVPEHIARRNHMPADLIALRRLAKKYNIVSTDSSLSNIAGIPPY